MDPKYLNYLKTAQRAYPGQSLTNDPANPKPFEKPPEYTSHRDAIEYLFIRFTEEAFYIPAMREIKKGVPIMELVQLVLFKGYMEGKWQTNLMMLLVEPATYMLMALAERAGIDYVIYTGEEEDEAIEDTTLSRSISPQVMRNIQDAKKRQKVPKGVLPAEIEEKIEEVKLPEEESLMEQPEQSLLEG